MKTRHGFVTNSSSSSFIISKKENLNSIDEVYLFLRTLFFEYIQKTNELIEYCKSDNRFTVSEKEGRTVIEFAKKKAPYEEYRCASDFIQKTYGMHWFDVGYGTVDWLHCETYNDFLEFIQKDNRYFFINIVDLENPSFDEECDIESIDSLIEWYLPCFGCHTTSDCNNCNDREYCYTYRDSKELTDEIKKVENKQDIIKLFFGRFCICSESGYIPSYVVNRLAEASTFWCNHMG